jgi:hypothetical protein
VNITRLPAEVVGVLTTPRGVEPVTVAIKSATGELLESAMPHVAIGYNQAFDIVLSGSVR